jgi:hypothetical protein
MKWLCLLKYFGQLLFNTALGSTEQFESHFRRFLFGDGSQKFELCPDITESKALGEFHLSKNNLRLSF